MTILAVLQEFAGQGLDAFKVDGIVLLDCLGPQHAKGSHDIKGVMTWFFVLLYYVPLGAIIVLL